ncbi:MAG: hypothetical protein AAF802_15365 [Planctomycetota bacterium]
MIRNVKLYLFVLLICVAGFAHANPPARDASATPPPDASSLELPPPDAVPPPAVTAIEPATEFSPTEARSMEAVPSDTVPRLPSEPDVIVDQSVLIGPVRGEPIPNATAPDVQSTMALPGMVSMNAYGGISNLPMMAPPTPIATGTAVLHLYVPSGSYVTIDQKQTRNRNWNRHRHYILSGIPTVGSRSIQVTVKLRRDRCPCTLDELACKDCATDFITCCKTVVLSAGEEEYLTFDFAEKTIGSDLSALLNYEVIDPTEFQQKLEIRDTDAVPHAIELKDKAL